MTIVKVDFSQSVAKLWNKYLLKPRGNDQKVKGEVTSSAGRSSAANVKPKESKRYEKKEEKIRSAVIDQKDSRKEWKRSTDPPSRDRYSHNDKSNRERSRDRSRERNRDDHSRSHGEGRSHVRRSRSRDRSRERNSHRDRSHRDRDRR